MNRSDQQRIYLQTIFDYFHENAEWPTYRYVDNKLFSIDQSIDAKEISESLPNGFANSFPSFNNPLDAPAVLSIEAIRTCDNSEADLTDFIAAVRFFVDMFNKSEEDHPQVTGADLKNQLNMTDDAIARVGKMINDEWMLYRSYGPITVDHYVTWQCTLDRNIRRFNGLTSIDDYLERRNKERITAHQQETEQSRSILGHMYRQPNGEDIEAGIALWKQYLTEPNERTGAKLEVALLNALARLGVPTLFSGDIQCGGPATPRYDLVALNYGAPMRSPTAVLISCKSTANQPDHIKIALLSDESLKVNALLPDWLVFGAFVNLGEPTSDEFNFRRDVRIWTQSDIQALLHAKELRYVAQFLWTPPWQWARAKEIMWWGIYRAHHKDG
jgi:hypothetical protein